MCLNLKILFILLAFNFICNGQTLNEYLTNGLKLVNDKKFNEAIESFTKALEIDKNYAEVYYHRGLAKFEIKDFYGAAKDFEKTLALGIADERYKYMCIYTLGLTNFNLGKYTIAVNYLDSALVYSPRNSDIYFERGKAKINMGKIEEGCEDFSSAVELGHKEANDFIRKYCIGSVLYEDNANWIKYGETAHFSSYYDPKIIKKSENIFFVVTKQVTNEQNYEESKQILLGKLNDSRFVNFKYTIFKYSVDVMKNKIRIEEGEWYNRDNTLIEKPDFQKVYEYYDYDGWKLPLKNSLEATLIDVVKIRYNKFISIKE